MHPDSRKLVDIDDGLARIRGNRALYKRMLNLFLNSEEFQTLEAALSAGEWQKAGDSAHTVKGMSGNLSLTAVYEGSSALVLELRGGCPPEEQTVESYRSALKATFDKIGEILPTL